MKVAVSVESTNDLSKELLEKYDIKVIPYQINLGGKSFKDGEYSTEQLFEMVNEIGVLPKTTAVNCSEYTDFFNSLKNDYDAVIHIALSSEITSSCNNAFLSSKEVDNVFVVDSQSLSTGIGLLAIYARELANEGFSPKEIAERVQERKEKLQVSFVLYKLNYMHKGGRCSSIAVLGANILKIRPRIILKDGKMISDKKYRGHMGQVISKYCEETISEFNTPDLDKVFITYTTATPEMLESARSICQNAGFKNIYETHAGGTIATHCGENTLGILYFNDGDKK